MTPAPGSFGPLLAATAKKSTGGSSTLLIIVLIGAAFYFLIYRPQQKKQKAARAQGSAYEVGDEVVTAGGIVGRVIDISDDRVTLETSVGASFTVLRPYVLRKLEPVVPPTDVVDGADDDEFDHDHEDDEGGLPHDETQHDEGSGTEVDAEEHPAGGTADAPTEPPPGSRTGPSVGDDGPDVDPHEPPPII